MGTRSITEVRYRWEKMEEWKTNAIIYRHWDGYLDGHGQWLFRFLDGMSVVNGLTGNEPEKHANGPGRLAGQIVAALVKDGHEPDLMGELSDCGQEYHYRVSVRYSSSGGDIELEVFDGPVTAFGHGGEQCTNPIFKGTVAEFGHYLANQPSDEEVA